MPGLPSARRVLVAEDEQLVRQLVLDLLTRMGFDVELSPDGRDTLNKYEAGAYDLLILDAMLACKTGLEVVTRLRDRGDPVPIILTSSTPQGTGRVEPFAFTYRVELLRKPFGARDLRSAIERATRRPGC